PFELIIRPYGRDFSVGEVTSLMSPVLGSSRPTMLAPCTVNQTMPSGAMLMVCGSFADLSGNGYSVVTPLLGSSLPIKPRLLPVNQMLPSLSSASPCGPVCGDLSVYSRIAPVFGSMRPSLLES